ncbi:MAG: hypothetical protein NC411_05135 [Bacteroides sp.]|nr:hypothetical protein [Bacteroides sp.]
MTTLTGCRDELFDGYVNAEGKTKVSLLVDFMPIAENSISSRAANVSNATKGDCMADIEDLCIVLFKPNGEFEEIIDIKAGQYTEENIDRGNGDASNGVIAGETQTKRRTIDLTLPVGQYYMYAVANLNDGTQSTYDYLVNECEIETMNRTDFRKIRRTWDYNIIANNSEMAGYFTQAITPGSSIKSQIEAPEGKVTVQPGVAFHCWLRRLASKVTVNFDARDLAKSTTIYIKSVKVYDIPYDCAILDYNSVGENSKKNQPFGLLTNDSIVQAIEFSESTNYSDWPYLTSGDTNLNDFQNENEIGHENSHYSLFFYENMQGEGESKHQDAGYRDENGVLVEWVKDEKGNLIPAQPDGYIDSPDSTNPDNPHYKDGKPAGTYIEVNAYYVSNALGNEGSGEIIYRFMLGKDADNNYDAERNHHFKLTLCFKGYANDYDWHIEYKEDQTHITIPNPYYISYGYNESLELPITIMGDIVDNKVTATIVRNDWWPSKLWEDTEASTEYHLSRDKVYYNDEDKKQAQKYRNELKAALHEMEYYKGHDERLPEVVHAYSSNPAGRSGILYNEGIAHGFLSLRKPHYDYFGDRASGAQDGIDNYIWKDWQGILENTDLPKLFKEGRTLGRRVYTFTDTNSDKTYSDGENDEDADGNYRVVVNNGASKQTRRTTLYLPLYTRQKNLSKKTAYSGENPYTTEQRRAQVWYSFKIKVGDEIIPVDTLIDIIQVAKLENPTGIWRDWNNAAPFDVVQKIMDGANSLSYRNLQSRGGWSAEVEFGADWIMLNGGKRKVYGADMTNIAFTYRPAGTLIDDSKVRCGVILIKYHNYTCHHRIFVRQGYAPIQLINNDKTSGKWHSFNMITRDEEAKSPLDEGSMFRYGNWEDAFDSKNSYNDNNYDNTGKLVDNPTPWINVNQLSFKDHSTTNFLMAGQYNADGTQKTKKWSETKANTKTKVADGKFVWSDAETFDFNGKQCKLMRIEDVRRVREGGTDRNTRHSFGILYGDKTTRTATTTQEAWYYQSGDEITETYGMRGCFMYNRTNGKQVFLPVGKAAHGHRKAKRNSTASTPSQIGDEYGYGIREVGEGVLRYAAGRITFMKNSGEKAEASYQPLFYDNFRRPGAVYWLNSPGEYLGDGGTMISGRTALDLNYFTFDFNTLGEEMFQAGEDNSDACFIRLVE